MDVILVRRVHIQGQGFESYREHSPLGLHPKPNQFPRRSPISEHQLPVLTIHFSNNWQLGLSR